MENFIEHITVAEKVEQDIRGIFSKKLFAKFAKAIVTYSLLKPGDKIAVCVSGGKDSMLMAKLFQELKRHDKFPFELIFLFMDPGLGEAEIRGVEANAELLNIPLVTFRSDIFGYLSKEQKSPCYICARMRRGSLYAKAKELGCNKIALGHHYDDVIETTLMSMLYSGQTQTMLPKIDSENFQGMQLIRPMYLIREADIEEWRDTYALKFLPCECAFSVKNKSGEHSKRLKVKEIIRTLSEKEPIIEKNIFKSACNVNLKSVISYTDEKGVRHYFDEKEK